MSNWTTNEIIEQAEIELLEMGVQDAHLSADIAERINLSEYCSNYSGFTYEHYLELLACIEKHIEANCEKYFDYEGEFKPELIEDFSSELLDKLTF